MIFIIKLSLSVAFGSAEEDVKIRIKSVEFPSELLFVFGSEKGKENVPDSPSWESSKRLLGPDR